MELLKVQNLSKIYGLGESRVQALKDVSFSLKKGEFAAVVGQSGSGKSTLLHCIGGLDTPTQGKIFLDGEDLFALDEKKRTVFRRRNIGFVFQAFHLIEELNVEQNIAFPLLLERRSHLPGQLSGGQKQRVAIGRALIMQPTLILADEPTGNLDSKSSRDVMDLLLHAARQYQQTILMITHNDNLAAQTDRILRVSDGCLKDMGGAAHEKLS